MRVHPYLLLVTALCAVSALIAPAVAPAAVTMQWVPVGNAGNDPQSSSNRSHSFSAGDGFGAVDYDFLIGQYMVTNTQYTAFLNAVAASDPHGLYNTDMGTSIHGGIERAGAPGSHTYSVIAGRENKPVVFVSWFDAARMANWMHNGQGTGDTETGAYTLNGATSGIFLRNPDATVWIPSEDEWFKAAYYNADLDRYFLYATGTDTISHALANYSGNGINTVTDVGDYVPSYYGTYDQAGNAWEWNDAVIGSSRGLRGGSWSSSDFLLRSSGRGSGSPASGGFNVGFRLASNVPEPSRVLMFGFAGLALLARRRRSTL